MTDPDAPGTPEFVAYWNSTPGSAGAGALIRDAEGRVLSVGPTCTPSGKTPAVRSRPRGATSP